MPIIPSIPPARSNHQAEDRLDQDGEEGGNSVAGCGRWETRWNRIAINTGSCVALELCGQLVVGEKGRNLQQLHCGEQGGHQKKAPECGVV